MQKQVAVTGIQVLQAKAGYWGCRSPNRASTLPTAGKLVVTTRGMACGYTGGVIDPRHRLASVAAVLYFVALAAIVFWPSPVDRPIDGALMRVIEWLHGHGLPQWFIGYRKVEFAANILMFVPFGVIIAARLRRGFWWVAVVAAAVLSGLIELAQALFLPARVPAWSDIVANTSGALIGAVLLVILRAAATSRPRRAPARR